MRHIVFSLLIFATNSIQAESAMTDETAIIAQRLRERLISSPAKNRERAARDLLDLQAGDGSWPDVDYDDASRTRWKPSRHLAHLAVLARAYTTPASGLEGDARVRDAFRLGLQYWVDRHPVSDNWWYNVIGAPRTLSDILLLMVDELSPELVEATAALIRESGFTRTGANLVDEARNLLALACATGDAELLGEAVRYISEEIRVTTEEGIQCDDSFHQHGPQNMVISYGLGFAGDQAGFAELFAGTSFAYSRDRIRILSRFILDGQQWYIRGRQIDFHAMGRGAFRGGPGAHSWNAGGFAGMARRMATADPARGDEYLAFAARVAGDQPAGKSGPLGNKQFWRSDTMVQRAADWYASVRFHSTRTYATETRTNRENLKGYHLSDGVYYLLQRGDEYHEIQPVWEYRKLPGLTFLDTAAPIPYGNQTPHAGNTSFVGGASDGLCGVSVMDYDKGGVRARKAYFFTPGGFACLGAGIESREEERVLTTLNQCRLRSDVAIMDDGGLTMLEGEMAEGAGIRAVHHDRVAYVMLEDAAVTIRAREQTGSWREVEARASDELVAQNVFTCWIDHGAGPDGGSYAYRVVPGTERRDLPAVAADESVRVLSNAPEIQAVHFADEGVTQAIFHQSDTLTLADGGRLTTDTPCAVMLRVAGDLVLLTVADPAQEHPQLILQIDGRYVGRGASWTGDRGVTRIVVDLPKGQYAGQSVSLPLEKARG